MNFFKRTKPNKAINSYEDLLDQELYTVPGTETKITWADAVEGTLITGATGSGKSSGPGRHAALGMLKSGFGFCVLCAKSDEKDRWVKYARETGRENDLVIFNKENDLKFNFLKYEVERTGDGADEVNNVVNLLMSLNEQIRIHVAGGDGKEEPFWNSAQRRVISRVILFLILAGEEVTIVKMRKVIIDGFKQNEPKIYFHLKNLVTTKEEIDPEERKGAAKELNNWIESNYFLTLLERIFKKQFGTIELEEEAKTSTEYWIKEFPEVPDKTKSSISEGILGIVEPFMSRGILKNQFSYAVSEELRPENIVKKNKIVIIDFPIKEYGLSAVFAATIYKTSFQSAMERRKIEEETDPKPVGLWIDEYQSYCSPMTDPQFQSTARSSWVASVYITQNLQNLFFVMGGNQPVARAKSLLGNLNLKYFASNACFETNTWASQMIGQHYADDQRLSISKDMELSKTKSRVLRFRVMPDHFTTLKTGRKANNYMVEVIVFKSGKLWGKNKENYALVSFNQN